jgi:hypothetical protein
MKIQTSVFTIFFTFISFIPTTSAITKAEARLKKVYLGLGLSSAEASSSIKTIKLALKEIANAESDKETLKWLIFIFESGLIIDLSKNGKKFVANAAQNIIDNLLKKKTKKRGYLDQINYLSKRDYLDLRNIIYKWLKNQLGQYDETSFNLAYTLQNNPKAETEDTYIDPINIFIYDIQSKSNALQNKGLEEEDDDYDDEASSLNSFESLSLASLSLDD